MDAHLEIDQNPLCGRRAALLGAGALGVAGLAACTGAQQAVDSATGAAKGAVGSASSAVASATDALKDLARTADIPVGGGKVFAQAGVIITQPTAGTFKAFTNVCTHQGSHIDRVADGVMECPAHHSKFSIADGSVVQGPATQPLPAKSVTVSGTGISVT